jgi:hypothetical protein
MSGKRNLRYHLGDRSEYLAAYALSRIAFIFPVPRQEEFGVVDFIVVTAKDSDPNFYPRATCCVQIKSNELPITFDTDSVSWISQHLAIPLFLITVDKKNQSIKIFSTWNMWTGLFANPAPSKLVLHPNSDTTQPLCNNSELSVGIGNPIIDATLDDFEAKYKTFQEILNTWIEVDQRNLARKSIGRNHVFGIRNHIPNNMPNLSDPNCLVNWHFFGLENSNQVEIAISPILTALAHGYRHNKNKKGFDAVVNLMAQLPIAFFDEHGKGFVNGLITYDNADQKPDTEVKSLSACPTT